MSSPVYCSLDLELSGFDPTKAEILEVGLVFFTFKNGKLKVTEKWQSVFKPTGSVKPNILGLTGITLDELEKAPKFAESFDFLQEKLRNAVIVGHNIALDVRFFESYGIKLSGATVDTLELAQIFLPTYHSYNLESLMHYFKIAHKNAHRALADAQAGAILLSKLLGIYVSLPTNLKNEILKLASEANLDWSELLKVRVSKTRLPPQNRTPLSKSRLELKRFKNNKEIVSLPILTNALEIVQGLLKSEKSKKIFVFPDKRSVLEAFKLNLGIPLLRPNESFDSIRFKNFISQTGKQREQTCFALKVLVWEANNWQKVSISDINVNFSGGQFIPEITAIRSSIPNVDTLILDQDTFLTFSEEKKLRKYELFVFDLDVFEKSIIKNLGYKVSWTRLLYQLKGIYSPETGTGNSKLQTQVVQAMAATDLLFGLVTMYLKPKNDRSQIIGIKEFDLFQYGKVTKAANNFVSKMLNLLKSFRSKELKASILLVKDFFNNETKDVKWIEFFETNVVLAAKPENIAKNGIKKALNGFAKVKFFDNELSGQLIQFFVRRFELSDYVFTNLAKLDLKSTTIQTNLLEEIHKSVLPIAILFNSQAEVKHFYEENYESLKNLGNLLAQNVTGGATKLLRNFSIQRNSIMLATPDLLTSNPWARIAVQTLFIQDLTNTKKFHPYEQAVSEFLLEAHLNYFEIKTKNTERIVLRCFYSKKLKKIFRFA